MGDRDRDEVRKYKFQALQSSQDIKCHGRMLSIYSKSLSLCSSLLSCKMVLPTLLPIPTPHPPPHPHCVQWMTAIGNQSNPEHLSLSVVAKAPQVSGGNEGKKVVEEREKIKKWVSRELSSKKQGKGQSSVEQLFPVQF